MTPEYREHPTRSYLTQAEHGNPVEVLATGKPTVRKAQLLSGPRKTQKAKASRRKAREIHNPLDRAAPGQKYPTRKGADVGLVNLLKTTPKIANRGAS